MTVQEALQKQPIVLFDGECGFCNKSIQYYLSKEKNQKMHFASLQSVIGTELRNYFEVPQNIDSIVLIKDHAAYIKSCAALRLTPNMKGVWPLIMGLVIVPPFIRNWIYDLIAKNRMKFFGRVENCALLSNEDKKRFLDLV